MGRDFLIDRRIVEARLSFPYFGPDKSAKRAIFTPYIKERVHEKDTVYQCGRLFVACGRLPSAFRKGE